MIKTSTALHAMHTSWVARQAEVPCRGHGLATMVSMDSYSTV